MNQVTRLPLRSILSVSGADASKFLQGLITNHMPKVEAGGDGMYACFLSSSGRILYDSFVYPRHTDATLCSTPEYLLDVDSRVVEDLVAHMKRYKLRKKVVIQPSTAFSAFQIWGPDSLSLWGSVAPVDKPLVPNGCLVPRDRFGNVPGTRDPRCQSLGVRVLASSCDECKNVWLLLPLSYLVKLPEKFARADPEEYRYDVVVAHLHLGVQDHEVYPWSARGHR